MEYVLFITAFSASLLTFFSGFGLGTLLMPVMLIWFPAPLAIALTGAVHFVNSLFKLSLTRHDIDKNIFLRFGIPAIIAALLGSWVLLQLDQLPVWFEYQLFGLNAETGPMKMLISIFLLVFVLMEYAPGMKRLAFPEKWLPIGGILSGFFGGLTGNQGALRSAFLVKTRLTKEQFVATSALLSACVDLTRLGNYAAGMQTHFNDRVILPFAISALAAMLGAYLGNKLLKKTTFAALQKTVALCLVLLALALGFGIL
jgi:uncharacterized membrane protein YfcA